MAIFNGKKTKKSRFRKKRKLYLFKSRDDSDKTNVVMSIFLAVLFVVASMFVLAFERVLKADYFQILPVGMFVLMVTLAVAFYVVGFQKRLVENNVRIAAMGGVFLFLLILTKLGMLIFQHPAWATATVSAAAIILVISYDQRFAMGMTLAYALLACWSANLNYDAGLLLITVTAGVTYCFSLREIRTRTKLLEAGAVTAVLVMVATLAYGLLNEQRVGDTFVLGGWHAAAVFAIAMVMQSLLPLIEKVFRVATAMTLIDYSDANQKPLRELAMEAPGTFSHSLLVGTIAEAAAQSIGCNGLLCRVGAYYHDIGKIVKPGYFIENQLGSASKHQDLSPAMSQLIIVGHVRDGLELARDEYKLPAVLWQFIEMHHGTTLVEYFYNEAKKKQDPKLGPTEVSESEFRYPGPKPQTKEAAIVMVADAVESAVRAMPEVSPIKVETLIKGIALKRLQDGQFDECDLTLRELSSIEESMAKSVIAHHHARVAYPSDETPEQEKEEPSQTVGEKV